jgi:hypothetical protein
MAVTVGGMEVTTAAAIAAAGMVEEFTSLRPASMVAALMVAAGFTWVLVASKVGEERVAVGVDSTVAAIDKTFVRTASS